MIEFYSFILLNLNFDTFVPVRPRKASSARSCFLVLSLSLLITSSKKHLTTTECEERGEIWLSLDNRIIARRFPAFEKKWKSEQWVFHVFAALISAQH